MPTGIGNVYVGGTHRTAPIMRVAGEHAIDLTYRRFEGAHTRVGRRRPDPLRIRPRARRPQRTPPSRLSAVYDIVTNGVPVAIEVDAG